MFKNAIFHPGEESTIHSMYLHELVGNDPRVISPIATVVVKEADNGKFDLLTWVYLKPNSSWESVSVHYLPIILQRFSCRKYRRGVNSLDFIFAYYYVSKDNVPSRVEKVARFYCSAKNAKALASKMMGGVRACDSDGLGIYIY